MYEYSARLIRLIDADTFKADVDLGFRVHVKLTFRVLDYDAPESWRPKTDEERLAGKRANAEAEGLLSAGEFTIRSHFGKSFDRWLAQVTLPDGRDYATVMIEAGHVKKEEWRK